MNFLTGKEEISFTEALEIVHSGCDRITDPNIRHKQLITEGCRSYVPVDNKEFNNMEIVEKTFTYTEDQEVNAGYLYLSGSGATKRNTFMAPNGIILDFGDDGELLGIEFLDSSKVKFNKDPEHESKLKEKISNVFVK